MADFETDPVLFAHAPPLGRITLNRTEAMNALTRDIIRRMDANLKSWESDPSILAVYVDAASGKAFCAGGDVRAMWRAAREKDRRYLNDFFAAEYGLNRRIKMYPKPYVSWLDGIVMGGGVGISVHGSHRIVTQNTIFAMPETAIGLFPDVGGSYFLSRLPHNIGVYLALTGARIGPADMLFAGLATHYIPAERKQDVLNALAHADFGEDARAGMTWALDLYHEDPGASEIAEHVELIERCFAAPDVGEIVTQLEATAGQFAARTAGMLKSRSPTSLKITRKQMRVGVHLDFDRSLLVEYRVMARMSQHHDFIEGVRAQVIDKDRDPKWSPARLEDVNDAAIDRMFGPNPEIRDLDFGDDG